MQISLLSSSSILVLTSLLLLLLAASIVVLSLSSSTSIITFIHALSSSPNNNNILNYVQSHAAGCSRSAQLDSCHMQSDASNYFCGNSNGVYTRALKFSVSPWAEVTNANANGVGGCALIEAISMFACINPGTDEINFFAMANLDYQYRATAPQNFNNNYRRSLLYFEDHLYAFNHVSTAARIYRFTDVLSSVTYDSFQVTSSGNEPQGGCISGTDSTNRKVIVQMQFKKMGDILITGSPTPIFTANSVVDTTGNRPLSVSGVACSQTFAYAVYDSDFISRFQTIPVLQELDTLEMEASSPRLNGVSLFADGQYLLVSGWAGVNSLYLIDTTKFPDNAFVEVLSRDQMPETHAAAVVAIPSGIDPRDGGTFKVFAFGQNTNCETLELEVKNLDQKRFTPPAVTQISSTALSDTDLRFCAADSAKENIYCGGRDSDVPVRITVDPVTIAVSGAPNANADRMSFCDLGEALSGYYCTYLRGISSSFRSFNIPSLSTRDTGDISNNLDVDGGSIAFATIGGSHHLFFVDEQSTISRVEVDGSPIISADLATPSSGALTTIIAVHHCPTEAEDKHVIVACAQSAKVVVGRVDGSLSNAAFPANAYDSHIDITDGNFVEIRNPQLMACTKSFYYLISDTSAFIAKFSISPFSVSSISTAEPSGSPLPRALSLSFDEKFLIVPSASVNAVHIFDTSTLNHMMRISSSTISYRCASLKNFKVYCPSGGPNFFEFGVFPFDESLTNTKSVSKTVSLQSSTVTRTVSRSSSLQSLTKTTTATKSSSLQSLTSTRTTSKSASLQSLTNTRTLSTTITPQSLTTTKSKSKSKSLQSLTSTRTRSISSSLQSLTSTTSKSKSSSLQSLTLTRSLSSSGTLQSITSTRTVSTTNTKSSSATLQSLTSTKSSSISASLQSLTQTRTVSSSVTLRSLTTTSSMTRSASLQSLTPTRSKSNSPSLQSLTRTISTSKSPSLQSLTSTHSLSKSSSLQSLTNTRTVTSTKTTSISATLQSLTATKSSSKSASLQSLTHTKSVSASITLQSLTATRSISSSASLQSLTFTLSSSGSSTLFSLTSTLSRSSSATLVSRSRSQSLVSLTNTQSRTSTKSSTVTSSKSKTTSRSLQSLTLTRSSSKSATPISLTKTRSKSSSATPFSRSQSLSVISLTQTQSQSATTSKTITSTTSKSASRSLQSLTVTQTPFSRSSTLSSSKTTSITSTFTLPPTPSTTGSLTATRSKTASLQSLSKTTTLSKSLQSLTKTKTKTSLVTPPPATTTTTTAAPGDNVINNLPPSSNIVNALVVSVPSCPSSLNSKCQIRHPQSNECRCPQNTYEQNITLLPSFAFLPSTSATSQLIDQVGNPCVRNEFTLGICTASTSERFISSYTRFGGTTSENGICEQVNPFTNDCSCRNPATKASFAIATGSPSSFIKKFVTFCLPPNGDLSVFWTIHPDVATSSSASSNRAEASCVSPNGNVTCECTAGASKTTFGVSIFPDSSSTDPVPGDLTFCKAKPAEPEEEVNLPVTTTGTVVGIVGGFIEGGGANAVVGIQVAALLMTLCDNNPNVSTSGAKSVVVFFEYPGLPPSAGGLAFMLTLTLGVFFLHALVCFIVGLKRFATSQKIEFDPDKIDYFEEEIETPSFFEQLRFASLQLRFPHWSFFVMNIGFSGVVVESTILLQNTEDDIMVVLGAIGLVLSLIYIALTLYYSYWGIRGVADVTIFDVDESGTSKKLVKLKKKFKKAVGELTEVPITDVDDEVFPTAPKSRATSSSRNNKSMSRHRARSSSSRKQSSSTRFRSFKAFSSRSNALSSDASASSSSSDEEQGHKWLNRRKSIQPSSSSTSNVIRNNSSRRKSNTASSKKPSSRRSSSQHSRRSSSEVGDDNSVIVYSDAEDDEEEEKSPEQTRRVRQDRKSSTVKMPTDDEDEAEESAGEKNDLNKSSSSSVFSKRNKQMKRAASNRRNPLRPPPRRIKDDEDTSSAEDLDQQDDEETKEEEEEENQHEQHQVNDNELTEDDKPPHYVKYGKAMKLFHRFCSFSEYILPNGWWIKHRLYNRRYASMYNSFQPRPTAWAPTTIRLFLFSVSVASSLGGCLIPVTYVGTVALLIALMFLVARPCRRPFDNILLALQLILGSTLAFSRSSNPELSVKLFYGVIGVTFVYVFHIMLLEGLETVSLSSLELLEFNSGKVHGHDDDSEEDENNGDGDDETTTSENSDVAQKKIAKALSSAHARHERKRNRKQ